MTIAAGTGMTKSQSGMDMAVFYSALLPFRSLN